MEILDIGSEVLQIIFLVLLAVKAFAFIHAATRRPDAYPAAGKMTKTAWLLILGLAVACDVLLPNTLLMIAGTVAAFVYILDVRPAIASITRR